LTRGGSPPPAQDTLPIEIRLPQGRRFPRALCNPKRPDSEPRPVLDHRAARRVELLLQTPRTQNYARRMGAIRRHGRRLRPRGPVTRPVKCVNPVGLKTRALHL
jgi:hypothetical protein